MYSLSNFEINSNPLVISH